MSTVDAGREVLAAWRDIPVHIYREEGLIYAIAFLVVSPLLVPTAALFYFSMSRETRELLDESEAMIR